MTKKSSKPEEKPQPGPRTQEAIKAAVEKQQQRPAPVRVRHVPTGPKSVQAVSPHADERGWAEHMCETFGTTSADFMSLIMSQVANMMEVGGLDPVMRANAALAAVTAIAPANEHETMIAAHIIGANSLAADSLHRAYQVTGPARDSYVNQATKAARTLAVLTDSLTKLRSGGKQQVEVRYVYVDARNSQNVITAGGLAPGGETGNTGQVHEPLASLAFAPGAPMPGPHTFGDAMSVPRHEGQEAVPAARRQKHRRAQG